MRVSGLLKGYVKYLTKARNLELKYGMKHMASEMALQKMERAAADKAFLQKAATNRLLLQKQLRNARQDALKKYRTNVTSAALNYVAKTKNARQNSLSVSRQTLQNRKFQNARRKLNYAKILNSARVQVYRDEANTARTLPLWGKRGARLVTRLPRFFKKV